MATPQTKAEAVAEVAQLKKRIRKLEAELAHLREVEELYNLQQEEVEMLTDHCVHQQTHIQGLFEILEGQSERSVPLE